MWKWISPNSTHFTIQLTTLLSLDNGSEELLVGTLLSLDSGSEELLVGFVPLLRFDYFSFSVLHNHFLRLEIAWPHGQDLVSPLQNNRYLSHQFDKNFLFQ